MLSDVGIREALTKGCIEIKPMLDGLVQPASVDLRLSNHIRVFKPNKYIRVNPYSKMDLENLSDPVDIIGGFFSLQPGQFILASTIERVTFDLQHGGRLEGKSSLGRIGLMVHSTAGFFDPGFEGHPTLEIGSFLPRQLLLWPGMTICQMAFFKLDQPASQSYAKEGKYADQGDKPQPSRYWMNAKP